MSLKGKLNRAKIVLLNPGFLKENLFQILTTSLVVILIFISAFSEQTILTEDFQVKDTNSLFLGPINKFSLESPDLVLIQKNSLKASLPPTTLSPQVLGALVGSDSTSTRKGIVEYVVEPNDTLWSIAQQFDVSLESLLWANSLSKNSVLKIGKTLVIPPVSGVIYHVQKGDTISEVAETYEGKVNEIIAFNELSSGGDIFIGDILIIPNGTMPVVSSYVAESVPLASGYFVCPISSPCRITQGLHWYNAVDFSHGVCGEPIYAAAAGTVLTVRTTSSTSKWAFGGAGNHIKILHPNGVVTMYGHISKSFVTPGQEVARYQLIALMGGEPGTPGAGLSTGCHVHFGVSGAANPFAK